MPEYPSDERLSTTPQRSGLDDDPLGMRRGRIIREAADLPLLIIQQPADTILWGVPVYQWSVLVWHRLMMANHHPFG